MSQLIIVKILKKGEIKMGCHTWCYDRHYLEPEEIEHYKVQAIKKTKEIIEESEESIEKRIKEDFNGWTEPEIEEIFTQAKEYRKYIIDNDILERISVEEPDDEIIETFIELVEPCYGVSIIKDGKIYVDNETCDPFRVYGYPEEKFFDAETLIDWLEKYDQDKIVSNFKGEYVHGMNEDIKEWIINFFKDGEHAIDFG